MASVRLTKVVAGKLECWLETVIITALFLIGGYYFNSDDPFFIQAQFPWIWFGPLLIALRYGIGPGITSVVIISIAWLVLQHQGVLKEDFPTEFILGGTLLTLISGQFSTIWHQRLRRSDQLSSHAAERIEQLSRAYFMVRLSHDRLEQNLISRPVTLRDAMLDLRNLLAQHAGQLDRETTGALMSILIHYCSLESAALYPADSKGRLQEEPITTCGKGAPLAANDLLLLSAMESGHTAYQAVNRLQETESSAYLVAAPLRTSKGALLGMLLITEMPFLALQRETLQILGVLLAYAADHADSALEARPILAYLPDCPTVFAAEMVKMVRLRRDLDISSALVTVCIKPDTRLDEICTALERQQRGLDHSWRRNVGWGVQFTTLMPFAGPASIEGYQARLNELLRKQFGKTIGEEGLTVRSTMIAADEPLYQLIDLLVEKA
ncbi:PelD GGDEF domain-containing protein [Pelotalea chapellei]|uniref:PelD GGDEF domain-containing protein n=1 Tax=Pelotalea chapellei TaxID=44671 RepID=A0ABS5U875_9BACT|nr:PelD GGDEF domain-containing protein [Pelotalea chapellei]MBT1071851.1 hypothetical protein [Pelotalea chapellei]